MDPELLKKLNKRKQETNLDTTTTTNNNDYVLQSPGASGGYLTAPSQQLPINSNNNNNNTKADIQGLKEDIDNDWKEKKEKVKMLKKGEHRYVYYLLCIVCVYNCWLYYFSCFLHYYIVV